MGVRDVIVSGVGVVLLHFGFSGLYYRGFGASMRDVFASSFVLYFSDALFVVLLVAGVVTVVRFVAPKLVERFSLFVTERFLRRFFYAQLLWMVLTLVGFKFVLLSSSVVVNKAILTGTGGSVEFSSVGEFVGACLIIVGAGTAFKWWLRLARSVDDGA